MSKKGIINNTTETIELITSKTNLLLRDSHEKYVFFVHNRAQNASSKLYITKRSSNDNLFCHQKKIRIHTITETDRQTHIQHHTIGIYPISKRTEGISTNKKRNPIQKLSFSISTC